MKLPVLQRYPDFVIDPPPGCPHITHTQLPNYNCESASRYFPGRRHSSCWGLREQEPAFGCLHNEGFSPTQDSEDPVFGKKPGLVSFHEKQEIFSGSDEKAAKDEKENRERVINQRKPGRFSQDPCWITGMRQKLFRIIRTLLFIPLFRIKNPPYQGPREGALAGLVFYRGE